MIGKISKKGNVVTTILLAIVAFLIVWLIFNSTLGKVVLISLGFLKSGATVQNNLDNTFGMVPISVDLKFDGTKCVKDTTQTTLIYNCQSGSNPQIIAKIKNTGTKMRTFYARPIVATGCSGNEKWWDCSKNPAPEFLLGTTSCIVPPGLDMDCLSGLSVMMKNSGTYRVWPGSLCELDKDYGCFSEGMTKPLEVFDENKWMIVKIA